MIDQNFKLSLPSILSSCFFPQHKSPVEITGATGPAAKVVNGTYYSHRE